MGEAEPEDLKEAVLSLPSFRSIDPADYDAFMEYMQGMGHIEKMDEGSLLIGMAGEKIVNNFRFYAVFKDDEEHVVYNGTEEIGSITTVPPPGYCFTLAGKLWKVEEVDNRHKAVYVKGSRGKVDTLWLGAGGDVHTRIMTKIREVLGSTALYPYLAPSAAARLERARRLAKESGLLTRSVLPAGGDSMFILPWAGSRQFRTLERLLKNNLKGPLGLRSVVPMEPYYMVVAGKADAETLEEEIVAETTAATDAISLLGPDEAPYLGKYDEFIPHDLLRKAFSLDGLDVPGLLSVIKQWKQPPIQ
jgi:ATP-dependent Lhr-like helicase